MPVITSSQFSTTFGAGHQVKDLVSCFHEHGHQYTVTWTFTGLPIAETGLCATEKQIETTLAVVREFADRNINKMLPAGPPTAGGLATYLLERLTMHGVTKVEVHESDTNVTGVAERLPG